VKEEEKMAETVWQDVGDIEELKKKTAHADQDQSDKACGIL